MTFIDLAVALNLPAGSLRVIFSRHKWSIRRPEDVRKFIATRFSGKKIQRKKQPWRSVAHLKKWQFRKSSKPETQNSKKAEKTIMKEVVGAAMRLPSQLLNLFLSLLRRNRRSPPKSRHSGTKVGFLWRLWRWGR
jgi:hypothetical protein